MAQKQYDFTSIIDNTRILFTLPEPFETGTAIVTLNDAVMRLGVDYTELPNTNQIQMAVAPTVGNTLVVFYFQRNAIRGVTSFTTAMLKTDYLFGLSLRDRAGNPITTLTMQNKIDISIAYFQRDFDIFMLPTVIKSNAILGTTGMPPENVYYDLIEPPYDYNLNDYLNWGYLRVRRRPIISVERIRLIYPTGQEIITYPMSWLKIYPKFGQIQIVPLAGSFRQYPLLGQGAMYLPLLSGFLTKSVPSLIHVDYSCGFPVGQIPPDFADIVYKKAAIEVLRISGMAQFPGVASLTTGADGLSETTQLTQTGQTQLFGSYIDAYQKDIDAFLNDFRETEKGITFEVL
jgi:hypothetical protein